VEWFGILLESMILSCWAIVFVMACVCLFHGLMSLTEFYIQSVSLFGISEYLDEAMLIPKNTSVLIRRVPGRPRLPIIIGQEYYLKTF
jgi:hypothetical protein